LWRFMDQSWIFQESAHFIGNTSHVYTHPSFKGTEHWCWPKHTFTHVRETGSCLGLHALVVRSFSMLKLSWNTSVYNYVVGSEWLPTGLKFSFQCNRNDAEIWRPLPNLSCRLSALLCASGCFRASPF
jgi:hypothetical protein